MAKMRVGRLALAGLVAGVVLNLGELLLNAVILGDHWHQTMSGLGLRPVGLSSIVLLNVLGFVLALAMVWLAAVFVGAGMGALPAALQAAAVAWLLAYVLGFGWSCALGVFSFRLYGTTVLWALVELPVAALAARPLLAAAASPEPAA